MTCDFLVLEREIVEVEECDFLQHGGEELHFGALADGNVCLHAAGSSDSISRLARTIRAHGTAATR